MKKTNILILLSIIVYSIQAQAPAKKKTALPKGAVVGTFTPDMDCYLKINASTKVIPVEGFYMETSVDKYTIKAGETKSFLLKAGANKIEAFTLDNKNTLVRTLTAKANDSFDEQLTFLGDNKFLDYVKEGNVLMVEGALAKNPSYLNDWSESLLVSPLETAIINSKVEVVKLLLNKGADFNNPEKIYPLHKSASFASNKTPKAGGKPDDRILVDLFLSKGCKISDVDESGNTALHCAVRANKYDLVVYLIEKGADVNAKNIFDDTPLKIAQDKGYVSIIDFLKTKNAVDK